MIEYPLIFASFGYFFNAMKFSVTQNFTFGQYNINYGNKIIIHGTNKTLRHAQVLNTLHNSKFVGAKN